jgi:hypothetical protein
LVALAESASAVILDRALREVIQNPWRSAFESKWILACARMTAGV